MFYFILLKRTTTVISLRSIIVKLLLTWVLVIAGGFLSWGDVFAQVDIPVDTNVTSTTDPLDQSILEWVQFFNLILNVLYLIIWPLLFIAGYSMDNSMVYWSVFWLDAPLWRFWNLTKNLANFTLGFLVLIEIFKEIFWQKADVKGIVTKTLIAWVWVQLSWFVMAALIDISTILTFTVGGIPLSILQEAAPSVANRPILMTHTTMWLSDFWSLKPSQDQTTVYYSFGKNYFYPCKLYAGKIIGTYELLQNPKNPITIPPSLSSLNWQYCVLDGYVIDYKKTDCKLDDQYKSCLDRDSTEAKGRLVTQKGSSASSIPLGNDGLSLQDITSQSEWYVWPLATLYTTLLDFGTINVGNGTDKTTGVALIEFLLKSVIWLLLIAPLIALAMVLLYRIINLWIIIALSPLYVLSYVFEIKRFESLPGVKGWWSGLMWIIFAPVLPVLALGMSIVFLTVIQTWLAPGSNSDANFLGALWIQKMNDTQITAIGQDPVKYECWDFVITTSCYEKSATSTGDTGMIDFVNWLVINMLAIGLMRWLVFAAFSANEFTQKIAKPVKDLGESIIGSTPIIPVPGGWKIGLSSLYNPNTQYGSGSKLFDAVAGWYQDTFDKAEQEQLNLLRWIKKADQGTSTTSTTYTNLEKTLNTAIGDTNNDNYYKNFNTEVSKAIADTAKQSDASTYIENALANAKDIETVKKYLALPSVQKFLGTKIANGETYNPITSNAKRKGITRTSQQLSANAFTVS